MRTRFRRWIHKTARLLYGYYPYEALVPVICNTSNIILTTDEAKLLRQTLVAKAPCNFLGSV